MMDALHAKRDALRDALLEKGRVAVAFSGGVDSALLLAVAHGVLGEDALAITAHLCSTPQADLDGSRAFCAERGIRQIVTEFDELSVPGFSDNPPDRCHLCKKALFSHMQAIAGEQGRACLCDGSNIDDEGDYRPGMRALAELDIWSPLREAGLSKAEIRTLSHEMGLPTWDKPSAACLSSRIPYGEKITAAKLARIEAAEDYLHGLGFAQVRVRSHGGIARVEVPAGEIPRAADQASQIACALAGLGFSYVALDLAGFRSGSMNEVL